MNKRLIALIFLLMPLFSKPLVAEHSESQDQESIAHEWDDWWHITQNSIEQRQQSVAEIMHSFEEIADDSYVPLSAFYELIAMINAHQKELDALKDELGEIARQLGLDYPLESEVS